MFSFNIYDYLDEATLICCDFDFEELQYIEVTVISGDEVIAIHRKGVALPYRYDASDCRIQDYCDIYYIVLPNQFEKWASYPVELGISYARANMLLGDE